jgi:predicted O-methyltransferase YrrM
VKLPSNFNLVKGFMDPEEGECLYRTALKASKRAPVIEIGSYCGKSTIYIGLACKENNSILYAIDHHMGSEENQIGWEYHDDQLFDEETGKINSFPTFRTNIRNANLENTVIPIVSSSSLVSRFWTIQSSMIFIDGGHSMAAAKSDFDNWNGRVMKGGFLAIHDVFPNPEDGGRPPYEIYKLALESNNFKEISAVKSLRILKRIS